MQLRCNNIKVEHPYQNDRTPYIEAAVLHARSIGRLYVSESRELLFPRGAISVDPGEQGGQQ